MEEKTTRLYTMPNVIVYYPPGDSNRHIAETALRCIKQGQDIKTVAQSLPNGFRIETVIKKDNTDDSRTNY